jgi:diguanylate cyclase (GGDEF)-like protein
MHVLLIEDQDCEALLVTRMLTYSTYCDVTVKRVASLSEAVTLLAMEDYDVCLMELQLPDGEGIDSLHRVRSVDARIPIVILSDTEDEQLGLQAIQSGAQDFIAKNCLSGQLLTRSLRFSIARHKTMLGYASDANTDVLTGLPNRRRLNQRFQELSVRSSQLSFALIDVDHFKSVNDTYGHLVGDRVLKHIADLIRDLSGDAAQAARIGGEEFALLIPQSSHDPAVELMRHLLEQIADSRLMIEGNDLRVTVSAGLTEAGDGEPLDEVIRRADIALYDAKRGGRNRCCTWAVAQTHDDSPANHCVPAPSLAESAS